MMTTAAWAGPPAVRELRPWGAQRGQSVTVTVVGDALAPGAEVFSGVQGKLEEQPGGNAGQLVFKLDVPPDAAVGVYPIRLRTPGGLSNELLFSIGDLPEVAETEPNDTMPAPTLAGAANSPTSGTATLPALALAATVNGTAGGTDQDVFRIAGKKGQRLVAEVEAQRIGSMLDPALHLVNAAGRELALADDTAGLGVDCRLDLTLPDDGDYFLIVHDTKYSAASPNHYRLKAGSFVYADAMFPLGWQRGRELDVSLAGGTFAAPVTRKVTPTAVAGANRAFVPLATDSVVGLLPTRLAIGDAPELLEPDAADDRWFRDAAVMNGRIAKPGEVDRYKFPVQPGQTWIFEVDAASLGSPLDALISVLGPQGNQLASADDGNGLDPRVQFQAPGGIDHVVLAVEDLHRRGAANFGYRLKARPVRSEFTLQVASPVINIPRTGVAVVQVNVTRSAYNGPIQLVIPDSVDGVTAEDGLVPEGANTGTLLLSAAADAPLRALDLQVAGQGGPAAKPLRRPASAAGRSPFAMAESFAARVPAAITEAPPVVFTVAERSIRIVHGHNRSLRIAAQRGPAATEPIAVNGVGLPPGVVGGTAGTIAKEANELVFNLQCSPENPVVAPFTMQLTATTTVAGRQETIQLAPVRVEIGRPFALEVLSQTTTIAPGGKAMIKAVVRRESPFDGAVKVGPAGGLPQGVSLASVEVPKGESLALVELAVADNAAPAEFDLAVRASTDMEGRKRDKDYVIPDTPVRVKIGPRP
jgi:hypothetical protein